MEGARFIDNELNSPLLSIVIVDVDSAKMNVDKSSGCEDLPETPTTSIRKILEDAEHRKHEFWKLIEEHRAVVENLKKIEKQESKQAYKMPSMIG